MPLLSSAATHSTIVSDTYSRTGPDTHSRLPSKLSDIILDSLSGHIVVSLSDIILDPVSDISWNTQTSGIRQGHGSRGWGGTMTMRSTGSLC